MRHEIPAGVWRRWGLRSPVAIGVALALVIAFAPSRGAVAVPAAPPAVLFPQNGALFGTYAGIRDTETKQQAIQRLESVVGRTFAIDHQYYKWDHAIPTAYETWTVGKGRIPFLNWKPARLNGQVIPWSSIAAGAEDAWIAQRAAAIKAFGHPMYLSFHHEPEDDVGIFGTPAEYAAAYRRIVDVFRAQGVTNVAFVWTMMTWTFDSRSGRDPSAFYPGDSYVDAVGSDGYNWYPGRPGSNWVSFQQVYQPTYAFAGQHDKPVMAVEFGVQEDPAAPGRKAQWFRDLLTHAQQTPQLKALIYFDTDKIYPWWIDTSPSSIAAYHDLGASAWLNAAPAPPSPSPLPSPTPSPTPSPSASPSPTSPPSPSPSPTPSSPPSPSPSPAPTALVNSLNGGTVGIALTPANTGGSSGVAFNVVEVGPGSALTFDTTHAVGPGLAAKHVMGSASDAGYGWTSAFGQRTVWYGRTYVWIDRIRGDLRLVHATDGGQDDLTIEITKSGRIRLRDAALRIIGTTESSLTLRGWVRIEWKVDHAAGVVEVRLFNDGDATVPTATLLTPPGQSIGSETDAVVFGAPAGPMRSAIFWTDDTAVSWSGYLGRS